MTWLSDLLRALAALFRPRGEISPDGVVTSGPRQPLENTGAGGRVVTSGEISVTPDLLRALGAAEPDAWAAPLARAMRRRGITTKPRAAAFLATVLHETGGFRRLTESLDYSPEGLMRTWPSRFDADEARRLGRGVGKAADQRGIAEKVYSGRLGNIVPGDGFLFRGRGLIQLTGRANYERAAAALAHPLDEFLRWIITPDGAAETAAWWWQDAGCNELADTGDIKAVRRRVNGGLNGLDDVLKRYEAAMRAL